MADRFPLVVDTTDNNKIKEIPNGDNLKLTGNSITGVVDITATGTITAGQLNVPGITVGGTNLAAVATSGLYSDLVSKPTALSEFTDDLNVLVPGDNVSLLNNNAGYLTTVDFATDVTNKPTTLVGYGITDAATSAQGTLATTALQPGGNVSGLVNDAGYVTLTQLQSGAITVDVNNSGDLVGSVFAQDSTVMIDGILNAVNLDGTIRGNIVPNANQHNTWDLGTNAVRFKDAYFAGAIYGDGSNLTGVAGSTGAVTFLGSTIDTNDSSSITITPAVVMESDLTVQNSLTVANDLNVTGSLNTVGSGTPEIFSDNEIELNAGTRIQATTGPFQMLNATNAQRDALTPANGDMIYNTDDNRFQVYQNGTWLRLDTSPIV